VTASSDHPYPPLELAKRVGGLKGRGSPLEAYEQLGAGTRKALLDMLPDDWSFTGKRVLDFGCGAGRTLRHFLDEADEGELWGTDIDGASIDWLQGALCPPLNALRCERAPPLGLEYATFDLIWAVSVFTHLPDNSIPWLLELHRLLKPEGMLIATFMGRWHSESLLNEPWDEDRIGMNVLRHDRDWDQGGPMVLMSEWWVRAHWGRAFEVLGIQSVGQSWALLRKRNVELTAGDMERPEDDPREFAALRHNLRQLQREIEQGKRQTPPSGLVARARRAGSRLVRSLRPD
jgi:SAM-dependent methyltransferase